ncbi:MAG TPA: Crp/Fnr family transcriptional regulator [Bacteroidia bacterium]|nr:Crp/Fnr family transcriptional regulator [Bacteroidia bacterium]
MFSSKIFKKYCSEEWLIIFETNKQEIKIKANQVVFNDGDSVKGIYLIEKGKVKVLSKMGEKDYHIIRLAGHDSILGHRGIHFKKYHIKAETLEDSVFTFIPIEIFIKIIKANPEMAIYLINFLSEELREAEDRMKNLSILDPKKRIAIILIKLIDVFGYSNSKSNLLSFTLKRSDIANMANTTYETVIRSLTFLEEKNLIEGIGKQIAIKNEKRLREFAKI